MNEGINKRRFVTSAIWKMVESLSSKGISTIISIILARILLPHDYGVVAVTNIFINFSAIFIQGGLNTSLIRKKEVDQLDYSVTLFFSLFIAGLIYTIFFFTSPLIAHFYKEPLLTNILRVEMLELFLYSLSTVQNAIVTREFRFSELCITSIISSLIGGIIGIIMAYAGFGAWSLVIYTLARDFLGSIILFVIVKWRLKLGFSFKRLKEIFQFSIWVLLSSLLDFGANNIYNTIYGKRYSMEDLGYYSKGSQLPELICLHTFGAITSVLLPTLSQQQDDLERMKRIIRKIVSLSCYIIFPLMGGIAIVSNRLIPFLFTERWNPCIPIVWAVCIYYVANPLRSINMQVIYASGNSKVALCIEGIRFLLLLVTNSLGVFVFNYDIYKVAFNSAAVAIAVAIITQCFSVNYIGYKFKEWLRDMLPSFVLTGVMMALVYILGKACSHINYVLVLFLQIIIGIGIYIIGSKLFHSSSYNEIVAMMKAALKRDK